MRPTSRSIGENGWMGFFYLFYISLVLLKMFEVDFVFKFYGVDHKSCLIKTPIQRSPNNLKISLDFKCKCLNNYWPGFEWIRFKSNKNCYILGLENVACNSNRSLYKWPLSW